MNVRLVTTEKCTPGKSNPSGQIDGPAAHSIASSLRVLAVASALFGEAYVAAT